MVTEAETGYKDEKMKEKKVTLHRTLLSNRPLPRPSLTAWPSSVVPDRGEVMLTCHAPTRDPVKFVLKRARQRVGDVPSPELTEGLAQFRLTGLTTHEAGKYTCEYHREVSPKTASPPSEALLLLVTEVTAGENVTLRCQRPRHVTESTHFALLKAGAPAPTQVSAARNGAAEFSLVSVTARDSGNYSCVHYMTRPPFWASRPSDAISIQVTGTTALALTAASALLLALLASVLIYKHARRGAAPDKVTTR
ncbi:T-cell-interacting, activating receptor on myeloid cells protein 1 [Galemys pyrenaicus]|nr:T-cell-interacting, activating receptor on myeloid cells protein 1 [Galemys pyrenaicus]